MRFFRPTTDQPREADASAEKNRRTEMGFIGEALGEVLYPSRLICILCKEPIPQSNPIALCPTCAGMLEKLDYQCPTCGRALIHGQICTACEEEKQDFDAIHSAFWYSQEMHRLIYRYKYGGKTYLARELAPFLAWVLEERGVLFDTLSYVPVSAKRKRRRLFDQAQLLSAFLGKQVGQTPVTLVKRTKHTPPLARLTPKRRKAELEGAFRCEDLSGVKKDARVLFVDDIFTTGVTLNEIAKTLKKQRPDIQVMGLTLCSARRS